MSYWAGRTVVVTGAGGFIGSHVVETLTALGANTIGLYRSAPPPLPPAPNLKLFAVDLLDSTELRAVLRYAAPRAHTVIHTAGMDGNAEFKARQPATIFDTNLRIGSNLLNAARDNDAANVLLVGSAEIYVGGDIITEDDDHRRFLRYTDNGYALSKTVVEMLAEQYRKQFGMRIFVPRPTNVYGPRDKVGRVIPSMVDRLTRGQEIVIWGDGRQTRSFVHVQDLVRTMLAMVRHGSHDVLTIATRETVSILQLARTLCDLLDVPERVRLDPTKPSGAPSKVFDTSRMYELIDFTPRTLVEGLRETLCWYRESVAA